MYGIRRNNGTFLEMETLNKARTFNRALKKSLNFSYYVGIYELVDGEWHYKEGA